ncbi:hypothetical protein BDQ17DRAFT_1282031 [Cyathus striatus]|nr:hypothetical protein BDQ17DRAFT_1282031 [Cyathus striatus]
MSDENRTNGPPHELASINMSTGNRGRTRTRTRRARGSRPAPASIAGERMGSSRDVRDRSISAVTAAEEHPLSPVRSQTTETKSKSKRGEIPCRAWKSGSCAKADKCWFGHDPAVLEEIKHREESRRAHERQEVERREREAYQAREAERRERERLAAEEKNRQQAQRRAKLAQESKRKEMEVKAEERRKRETERRELLAKQDAEHKQKEASAQYQHNALRHSLVTYSAGIAITRVVPGFNLALITVRNLPSNAKGSEVKELFTQQGIHSDDVFVAELKTIHAGQSKHMQASVYAKSDEAGAVAVGLEGVKFRDKALHFDVKEVVSEDGMGSTAPGSPVLIISWYLPSVAYAVDYPSPEEARQRVQTLNQSTYGGRKVTVQMQSESPGMSRIRILGLPPDISQEDLAAFVLSTSTTQLHSKIYDVQESITVLQLFLDRQPPDRRPVAFEVISENKKGSVIVRATFATWAQAKQARDTLHVKKKLMPHYPFFRLFLPKELQYSVTVPRLQYQAQKARWDVLKSGGNAASSLQIFDAISGYNNVLIKVLGDDKKAVGALKVRAESLAAGEKLGPDYWKRSFTTREGRDFMKSVFDQTGVYVSGDWKRQTLKVYGNTPGEVDSARRLIMDEIARLESMELTIPLTTRLTINFLMRRGMDILKDIIGEDNLTLDLTSRPPKLVVRGGQDAKDHANRVIAQSFSTFTAVRTENDDNKDTCPVCYDDVEHPEQLVCGHTYCTSCLRRYVMSETDRYPLVCIGAEATCGRPISIPVIQRLMSNHARFSQLLDKAFKVYIDQHPDELKYCATPDCEQVYRCDTEKVTELQCPSCLVSVCSACDTEAHTGMTCEESRISRNPMEQERLNDEWAKANGVKKCPRCQVLVQKTEGCNHMSCRCGAHFCWICNGVFERGDIYSHMSRAHGGWYAPDLPEANQNQAQAPVAQAPLPAEYQRAEFIRAQEIELNRIQLDRQIGRFQERGWRQLAGGNRQLNVVYGAQEPRQPPAPVRAEPEDGSRGWCIVM